MKICMYIPTLYGGGAERVFVNLANFFVANGAKVILISENKGVYGKDLDDGVIFTSLKKVNYRRLGKLNILANFVRDIFLLSKIIKREHPDVFFCTLALGNIKGTLVKKIVKKTGRLFLRQANVLNTINNNKILNFLLQKSFQTADGIIANSYDTARSIESLFDHKVNLPIHVLGNPIFDSSLINKANETIELDDLRSGRFLLNVGRLIPEKDQINLIRALKIVQNKIKIDLIILGQGPLEEKLREEVKKLGLEDYVHLKGFVGNPYPYYKMADIFVLSSITEGFGNVIVEALAIRTPVISTDCMGGPSFILERGKYGDLVRSGDPKALADCIVNRLTSLEEIDYEKLQKRAEAFSVNTIGKEYLNLFKTKRK